jgi:uncharacterized protein YcnI
MRLAPSIALAALLLPSTALAHVSVSGPGIAGTNQVLTFSVGHGCEGADTYRVEIMIPAEVTSLRVLPSTFGEGVITKDAAGAPTAVTFTKAGAIREADDAYYQVAIRAAVPDLPFKKLYFKTVQTCRDSGGVETTVPWTATAEEIAANPNLEPAPELTIVPKRKSGWNKITVASKLESLAIFDDALIVWAGTAAYSGNSTTMDLIKATSDVQVLATIEAGTEIWVKY